MKSMVYFIFIIVVLCVACYDDKGNSDYLDELSIRVENVEHNIKVTPSSMLNITPRIYPEDRHYDCFWGIVDKNKQYSVIDTLSKEKDLNFFVDLRTGIYLLRFCAKDVETGIFSYTEYNLSVGTEMDTGWWILKDGINGTDVDLFTPTRKLGDVLYTANGYALKGEALDMTYTNFYWEYDSVSGKNIMRKAIFFASDKDLAVVDFFSGQYILGFDDLFYEIPQRRKVQALFRGPSDTHVVVDDQIYTMPNMKYDCYRQFSIKHQGSYDISCCRNASGWGNPLLFDEQSSSFCSVSRNSLEINMLGDNFVEMPHRNLGMDLLFLGGRTMDLTAPGEYAYAILKKRNLEKYVLAYLSGAPSLDCSPMLSAMKEIPAALGVLKADYRTINQDNDVIYFSKNDQLYSCNLQTLQEEKQVLNLEEGEKITYMEFVKYMPWNLVDKWFTYLVIGTVQGDCYKLYLHPVQAAHVQPAIEVMEGIGRIKRVIYIGTNNGIVNTSTFF